MGNNLERGFTFAGPGVHGHESILIPGQIVIKECLEEIGVLGEYMTDHHQWIGNEYGTRSALSLTAFFISLLACYRHNFKLKELILVVGTVKTNNWAIAVTSKSGTAENISFTISSVAKAKVWGEWSGHLSVARCGPYMSECCHYYYYSLSGSNFRSY